MYMHGMHHELQYNNVFSMFSALDAFNFACPYMPLLFNSMKLMD